MPLGLRLPSLSPDCKPQGIQSDKAFRIPLAIPPDAKSVVVDARELHLILGGLNHKLLRKARATVAAIRASKQLSFAAAIKDSSSK